MIEQNERLRALTRRYFIQDSGLRLASIALSALTHDKLFAGEEKSKQPHFAPKAKHIIYLFMAGGPSQVDLLDYKPTLTKFSGQNIPDELLKNDDPHSFAACRSFSAS